MTFTSDPQPPGTVGWLRGAWADRRWIAAAVWLVFLFYPIASVIDSHRSAATKIVGLVLIGCFAVLYSLLCMLAVFRPAYDGEARPWPVPVLPATVVLLALVAVIAGLTPVLRQDVFGLAPYLVVCAVFVVPNLLGREDRPSILWGTAIGYGLVVLIVGGAVVVSQLVPGWSLDNGTIAILFIVAIVMPAMRAMQVREIQREELARRQRVIDERLAVVAERERVARDVHDVLGHSLTVMTVKSELAERLVDIDPERAKAEIADMQRIARSALSEVRSTVGGMRTPDLGAELLAARTALSAAQIDPALPADVEAVDDDMRPLFAWVLREAVTNVVRHSEAEHCRVELSPRMIVVEDDGRGFGGVVGHGLRGLTERVMASGGRLDVGPAAHAGTRLVVTA